MNALRQLRLRGILWVFAAALLLKAAVPFLASASAEWQGKSVAEICTAYGVVTVPMPQDGSSHEPAAAHGGEHCALLALPSLAAAPAQVVLPGPGLAPAAAPAVAPCDEGRPHACATWVARLKHGPPRLT